MFARMWLAPAVVSAAIALPAATAEPDRSPAFGFSTLKPAPEAAVKPRLEGWLKAAGKYDAARFETVWSQSGRSVADRTLDSIAIGMPDAVALITAAKQPGVAAPTEAPAVFKDTRLDPFVRANLAAAYAKTLAGKRVYEEALDVITGVAPEQVVDPAAFFFYKAVAEHALIRREAAVSSIVRLLDDVADAPDRYKVVATLMFFDLQNWAKDEKDLSNISRLMDNSERRLELARGGPKTQDIQKKIVFRLDEKIKELENKAKAQSQQCQSGQCPNGGQPGNNGGQNPNSPMDRSQIATNGGPGNVDARKLRQYEENWGKLPEAERKEIVQQVIKQYPPKYQAMIEDYFRSLNRLHGYRQP